MCLELHAERESREASMAAVLAGRSVMFRVFAHRTLAADLPEAHGMRQCQCVGGWLLV